MIDATQTLAADLVEEGGLALVQTITPADARDLFATPGALRPLLDAVAASVRAIPTPDLSTESGRKEVASLAYRVARAKTRLDDLGKDLVAELKELPKRIDAGRKEARDFFDALKDEVRAPLEVAEKAAAALDYRVAGLSFLPSPWASTVPEMKARLAELEGMEIDETFEPRREEAFAAREVSVLALREMIDRRANEEADREELEELRRMKAAREAEIAQEEARRLAAEKAEAELIRARAAAQEAAEEAAAAEARRLIEKADAEIRAKAEAEAREKAAVERAARAAEEARLAEVRRQEAQKEAEAREARRRAEDLENRKTVNREAIADLMAAALISEEDARAVIGAISSKSVRRVSIAY